MFRHSSIIKKLFFSYLLLTIPILLVSFLVTQTITEKMKNETNTRITYQEEQIINALNEQYIFYRDSSARILTASELSRDKVLENSVMGQRGIAYLLNVKLLDRNVYDIFMYYGENALYSATGYVRPKVYFETVLKCTPEAGRLALDIINSDKTGMFYLDTGQGGYLLYHYPGRAGTKDTTNINYCISFSNFAKMLKPVLETNQVLIQITFGNNGTPAKLYMEGTIEQGIQIVEEETAKEYRKNAKDYIFLSKHSELTDITLEVSYRSDDIYQEANNWQRLNGYFMAALLLASIMISYFLSRSHYRNVNQLKTSLETVWSLLGNVSEGRSRGNEFEYMQKIVQSIMADSNRQKLETMETRQTLKHQTALLLYHGMLKDEAGIRLMLKNCGVKLGEDYFFVVCIAYLPKDQSIMEVFKAKLDFSCYCEVKVEDRKALAVLFELSTDDLLMAKREKIGKGILSELQETKLSHIKISFSQTYRDITQTSHAYLEAVSVLQKLLTSGTKQRLGFMDTVMENRRQIVQFEDKDIESFTKALKKASLKEAAAALEELFRYAKKPELTQENSQYLRYCILQIILSVLREFNEVDYGILAKEIALIDTSREMEFKDNVIALLRRICISAENVNENFLKGIQYIKQNFSRPDLSLDEVAEYMGLSKSYMSRLFKEKTGNRYIEYLTLLRMERAKELLMESNQSIKDIAGAVGYYNVPGFRKKFKEYYGISASEYRKGSELEEED